MFPRFSNQSSGLFDGYIPGDLLLIILVCSIMVDSAPGFAAARLVGLLAYFILDVKSYFGDSSVVGASNKNFVAVFWADWIFPWWFCFVVEYANEGNSENMKDDLSGLDKAMGCVPRQRTIECNQLLVSVAKSKLSKTRDEKNEKVTKPEELVRLNDLLLQNIADLADMLRSGRDRKEKWRYLKNVNSKA
ncbi:hypothetical protein L1887_06303 [Cichorium endivia]|nr:hypothetical protein L1887_06303 [Cichorium endivia]